MQKVKNDGGGEKKANGNSAPETEPRQRKTISDALHDLKHASLGHRIEVLVLGGCVALPALMVTAYYYNNMDKPKLVIYSTAVVLTGFIWVGAFRLDRYFSKPPTTRPSVPVISADQRATFTCV
jgi:hypothetical protein